MWQTQTTNRCWALAIFCKFDPCLNMKKSLHKADFYKIGGYDKDRTCDPYDVNVVLSR